MHWNTYFFDMEKETPVLEGAFNSHTFIQVNSGQVSMIQFCARTRHDTISVDEDTRIEA